MKFIDPFTARTTPPQINLPRFFEKPTTSDLTPHAQPLTNATGPFELHPAPRQRAGNFLMPKTPDLPCIHMVRKHRVMLDSDLARLYGVNTTAFNQAIRRNFNRFPPDFVFEISYEEHARLISQIVTSNAGTSDSKSQTVVLKGRGGRRKSSLAFTEHGAIMAATVLRSPRAVAMSVYVVRAFVQMRDELLANATIFKRLAEIDKKLVTHDVILRDVYEKLRPLLSPPPPVRKELGFHTILKKP